MGPRFQGDNLSGEQHHSAMEYAEAYHPDAVPDLIKYKAKSRLERWIGGIYNWETKHWVWGATGEDLVHQGFSRQNPNTDHKWHCIMMDPTNHYRWNAKSCVHKKHYICETPLKKATPTLEPSFARPDWIRLPGPIQLDSRAYTGAVFRPIGLDKTPRPDPT
uniref:C-type lectin domain-containing protein n=1 Tax=Timema cristinae TaxID=61476 RepID=A0A7R9GRB0_TIMCR|nr:unnamed protein product [Timema cristinae]